MTKAFSKLLGKEISEFARTWRIWVLLGFVLFFALTSPILAKLTPEILKMVGTGQSGVVIKMPPPTWRDSYAQWLKNLSQLISFVVLIIAAGSVAGEVASGTAVLVLTKPVSRADFVVAKAAAVLGYVIAAVVLGTAIVQVETLLVFGSAPPGALWGATIGWLLFAIAVIGLTMLFSATMPTLAAAGVGVVGFFALAALTSLLRLPAWGLLLAGPVFVAAAAVAFSRREL